MPKVKLKMTFSLSETRCLEMRRQLYLFLKLLILFEVWSWSYKSVLRDPQITQV